MEDINIGVGVTFPLKVTEFKGYSGVYPVEGDIQLIQDNLVSILQYTIGQRIRQEDFGNKLISIIEEPNNLVLDRAVYTYLRIAISKYEPRIKIKDINTIKDGSTVNIVITYNLISNGSEHSLGLSYNLY
jgi:phage baseplate assembly protein W